MPALITHHIFGEDAVDKIPEGLVDGEEELLAFLLGNQGPDPFFARFFTLPERAKACHQLAHDMQSTHVTRAFMSIRDSVAHLPRTEERIGRAFALGLVGHYTLDRTSHPLIFAEQYRLTSQPEITNADHEVHAILESDIDSWILWEKRGLTIAEEPAASDLMSTERIERVGGALFSQTALSVFGIAVGPEEFAGSVRDYRWIFRRIDPAGAPKTKLIGAVERLGRAHSMAQAMGHWSPRSHECASANLERRPWKNPFTGETRNESFADLYEEAVLAYPQLVEAFVRGDEATFRKLVGSRNYDGRPGSDD